MIGKLSPPSFPPPSVLAFINALAERGQFRSMLKCMNKPLDKYLGRAGREPEGKGGGPV